MTATDFHPGQRWISDTEPELGLGAVLRVGPRTVTIAFAATAETREYARDNAPLARVRFKPGDAIKSQHGQTLIIDSIREHSGLLYYRGVAGEWCETQLSDTLSFNKPEQRLRAARVDPPELFDLRLAALRHQHRRRQSELRGFAGARIDLIPHQLYIAAEVAGRLAPRVLLADEVGLGKTIEACLILHRLILTGRAQRVLIVVPESLVHQWFVELLRRFNLWFHIFDEGRCEAIQAAHPEANPFLDDQFVLASLALFAGNPLRLEQALAAGWDLVVVDEAHHLGWAPNSPSAEYAAIEALGRQSPGLLLLTATPEQLGRASHFARLRLLDADRFYDLQEFILESELYRDVARLADKLLDRRPFTPRDAKPLAQILAQSEASIRARLDQIAGGDQQERDALLDALLDQHGTGRVMFRNTRAIIRGFPKRAARLQPLPAPAPDDPLFQALAAEFAADLDAVAAESFQPDFTRDPRLDWLAELLRGLGRHKVLLICRTQRKAEAIEAALRRRLNVKAAVFHEGLPLVQRDRNAAWFAEPDGARLLLCSEIGSEGRNFQFAHHLVLFDLPLDPELLEQRIGRIDRIGQISTIQIHVPFVTGSPQQALARWHHEGLDAFERNLHGGRELLEQFQAQVADLAQDFHETLPESAAALERLVADTRAARIELARRLEQGRDRLLELNSFRAPLARRLVKAIELQDGDSALEEFLLEVFDHFSVQVEALGPRTYQLGSAGVFADSFPGLPADGLTVTCDRARALAREDVQFLTWDHPIVTGALDLLLGSERGNSSFALHPQAAAPGLLLETIFLVECVAPPALHVDRFLPPTPLRVVVDHHGQVIETGQPDDPIESTLQPGDPFSLLDRPDFRDELLPHLISRAQDCAAGQVPPLVARARAAMASQLDHEIERLEELRRVNRSVRSEEINLLVQQRAALDQYLTAARLRLDAIRVIRSDPG